MIFENSIIMFGAFGILSLPGAYIAYFCTVWKIVVLEDTITFVTVFKKPQTFCFGDIYEVKKKADGIAIYYGEKRKLKLETNCVGYEIFVERLRGEGKTF